MISECPYEKALEEKTARLQMVAQLSMEGNSQTKIAKMLGVSKQRVGQLIGQAEKAGMSVVRRQIKKKSCLNCGKIYPGKNKFCSKDCLKLFPKKFGGPASYIEVDILLCDGCGTKFARTKRLSYIAKKTAEKRGKQIRRFFCTKECYHKHGNHK